MAITVRCAYCNGHFERTGRSIARYCSKDCEYWASHTEYWDTVPPPARPEAGYSASEVIAWLAAPCERG